MRIITYASSSDGNLYKVKGSNESLLLEAGLTITNIKKHLNYDFSGITGCLVSHEHKDHSKCVSGLCKFGINCYMSEGTQKAIDIDSCYVNTVESKKQFNIGKEFTVMPLDTQHDACEPFGYVIYNKLLKTKLLFITDTYYFKYKIPSLTHIMIESNYNLELLDENIKLGIVEPARKPRLIRSHFEESRVLEFFEANDLSKLQEVLLIHTSKDSSTPDFDKVLQEKLGSHIKVSAAKQ